MEALYIDLTHHTLNVRMKVSIGRKTFYIYSSEIEHDVVLVERFTLMSS